MANTRKTKIEHSPEMGTVIFLYHGSNDERVELKTGHDAYEVVYTERSNWNNRTHREPTLFKALKLFCALGDAIEFRAGNHGKL